MNEAKTNQFAALDIRKAKAIHPRTLNRYLQELKMFSYIQVTGGNKHREGFIYKLTNFGNHNDTQSKIETDINKTLDLIKKEYEQQSNRKHLLKNQTISEQKQQGDALSGSINSPYHLSKGEPVSQNPKTNATTLAE